jgi:hypothetical protein
MEYRFCRSGYDQYPNPFFVRDAIVNISDDALRSVAFIGIRKDGKFLPRATCFFADWIEDQHHFDHLVTAEHVVSGLLTRGHDIWLRVNLVNGKTAELKLDSQTFRYHPKNGLEPTDVAVYPFISRLIDERTGEATDADIRSFPLNGEGGLLPTDLFRQRYMGRGGEISIIGLFRSHYGHNRNIPIVRVGNIAALPQEPVSTKLGFISAYLIEARSIAGLSGSPVMAMADNALELIQGIAKRPLVHGGAALLGLMHGHFDVPNLNEDVVMDEEEPTRSVHTGIGVVIPVEKIVETIQHPELVAMRKERVKEIRKTGATADLATDPSAASHANDGDPTHREDFNSLLLAAVQKRESED